MLLCSFLHAATPVIILAVNLFRYFYADRVSSCTLYTAFVVSVFIYREIDLKEYTIHFHYISIMSMA